MDVTLGGEQPGLVMASGSGGSSGSGPSLGATPSVTAGRRRTPGRWKRIPRFVPVLPPGFTLPPAGSKKFTSLPGFRLASFVPTVTPRDPEETSEQQEMGPGLVIGQKGSKELLEARERSNQRLLEQAKRVEEMDEDLCDTEEAKVALRAYKAKFSSFYRELAATTPEDEVVFVDKPRSDTQEEHLTAEEMEMEADRLGWLLCPQARHFAMLALEHYNSTKKTRKFELARVLLSKCFIEVDGTTYAHVNFTATPDLSASHPAKRLFFAELMLIPDLQAYEGTEPMRVLHVCTIDDSCFGGCHEIERDIKKPVRKDMDYDRCHACSDRIKHPRGTQFIAGHNCSGMQYISAFAWTYKSM